MLMVGDDDEPYARPEFPRKLVYERPHVPKYYLILKDATHYSFSIRACGKTPLYLAVERVPPINVICQYGFAFFQKYLKRDISANEQLAKSDSLWAYYVKEEKTGEVVEWGHEPEPGQGGSSGRGFFRRLRNR